MLSRRKRTVYNKQKNIKSRRTYKRRKRSKTKRRRRSKYSGGVRVSKKEIDRRKKREEKLSLIEKNRIMKEESERKKKRRDMLADKLLKRQALNTKVFFQDNYGSPPSSDDFSTEPQTDVN